MEGDYITAIECLTVIEESIQNLNKATRAKILKILNENPVTQINEKKELTLELIAILER
jgi:hypothetical protein